jgi:hypothetical protein
MRIVVATLAACLAAALVPTAGLAATPAQEQAFVDTYRKAFEAKDAATLHALLYTKGADPKALGFYRMMTTVGMGSKIASIALVDLTTEDRARADRTMPSPDGKLLKLSLEPVKKLVIRVESKTADSSSTGTSEVFVAEHDGRLWIPVPAPAR